MKRPRILKSGDHTVPSPPQAATVAHLPTFTPELCGHRLDLELLRELPDGRALVQALVDWQGSKRGGYTIGLDVRRYMRHVVSVGARFGKDSLEGYRSLLDSDQSLADGTRQSYYSNAAAYVACLAKRGVIKDEKLPPGFRGVRTTPKKTFAEAVGDWGSVKGTPQFAQWIGTVAQVPHLDRTAKEVLAVSHGWMGLLEDSAAMAVRHQMADWVLADEAIRSYAKKEQAGRWPDDRSVGAAIAQLHATFGYILPCSIEWPRGVADYCKYRGWSVDRVRAALFPTVKSLDAFLVLALSNADLAPNVDSVLFYAFTGCVTPTDESSRFRVAFGKFRGSGPDAHLERPHALVEGLQCLDRVVIRAIEPTYSRYKQLVRNGGLPLFLHACTSKRSVEVKTVDPTMGAYMVRRFIRGAAKAHPTLAPLVGAVTGEHFRTTHLLIRRLRGESLFTVQRVAKHSDPDTTVGYLDRIEIEATNRIRHRDYQNFLISEARARRGKRLGNGFHCEPGDAKQEKCVRLDACSAGAEGCSARRIVLESPKIVAEWLAWAAHIANRAAYLKEHRPERWAAIWGPRLVEYQVLLESTSASTRARAEKYVPEVALLPVE